MKASTVPKEQTPAELQAMIDTGETVRILDIRETNEVGDWRIEGPAVRFRNIPFAEAMAANFENVLGVGWPKDHEITVVCYGGLSSRQVAQRLRGTGYSAVSLAGGMEAYGQLYAERLIHEGPRLAIHQVQRVGKGCLSYLIRSRGEALVVDPARDVSTYLELAEREGVVIRQVVDTHLHADHISGGPELQRRGADYYLAARENAIFNHRALEDCNRLTVGGSTIDVVRIPSPGHTPGSVSLLVDDTYLLTGDTVFVNGLGRPDLGGKAQEWAELLFVTVRERLQPLPDDLVVLPAHYAGETDINADRTVRATLGSIRKANVILGEDDQARFVRLVTNRVQQTPPNYQAVLAVNRGTRSVTDEEAASLEAGPNRCAVRRTGQ